MGSLSLGLLNLLDVIQSFSGPLDPGCCGNSLSIELWKTGAKGSLQSGLLGTKTAGLAVQKVNFRDDIYI
jgi:hypothetical protein